MARTSKRNKQATVKPAVSSRIYSVGIYARLSVDGTERKNESLENQLELCKAFVAAQDDMELFDCYSDLGKTGTNFRRDDFERLMADIRMRKVDCVVVKDLSRFGRNHIEMGNYLGKIFPFLGVRFIAVNDDYDSVSGDPETLAVQLKNLVNELYAKDVGTKIRSAKAKMFERGSYIGRQPGYGYRLERDGDRRVLVVNEEAAAVVRQIFDKFISGSSVMEIREWLYVEKIHRPKDYFKCGHIYQQDGEELYNWNKSTIATMLNSCIYAGHLLYHQVDGKPCYGRTSSKVLAGELKVVWNNHPAIISEEVFREVARLYELKGVDRKNGTRKSTPVAEDIYSGLLYCGLCGERFKRSSSTDKGAKGDGRYYCYYCANRYNIDGRRCRNDGIGLKQINMLVEAAMEKEFSLSSIRQKDIVAASNRQADVDRKKLDAEIGELSGRIDKLRMSGSEDYMRFQNGEITQEEMMARAAQRKEDICQMQNRKKILDRRLAELGAKTEKKNHYLRTLMKCKKDVPLTSEITHTLIKRIEVFPQKRLEVCFAYSGGKQDDVEGGGMA